MKSTDSLLISLYQKGDEEALSTLIHRHQKDLFSFILYKINDEDLAKDVFQDTFIKIIVSNGIKNMPKFAEYIIYA